MMGWGEDANTNQVLMTKSHQLQRRGEEEGWEGGLNHKSQQPPHRHEGMKGHMGTWHAPGHPWQSL